MTGSSVAPSPIIVGIDVHGAAHTGHLGTPGVSKVGLERDNERRAAAAGTDAAAEHVMGLERFE